MPDTRYEKTELSWYYDVRRHIDGVTRSELMTNVYRQLMEDGRITGAQLLEVTAEQAREHEDVLVTLLGPIVRLINQQHPLDWANEARALHKAKAHWDLLNLATGHPSKSHGGYVIDTTEWYQRGQHGRKPEPFSGLTANAQLAIDRDMAIIFEDAEGDATHYKRWVETRGRG